MIINSLAAMPLSKLKRAIEIREQIDALTHELDELTGDHQFIPGNGDSSRLRGAHLHWPTRNGNGNGHSHATNGHSFKTRLSAEGRAKVSAAVKARWARYRAAKARSARAK